MCLKVDLANDVSEAVNMALDNKYDIIFMDVQMPNKSGIEASEELIEKIPFSEMPLIFALSASTFKDVKDKCFNAGMSGFLAKPLNLSALNEPLDLALSRKIKDK
jgi:CheY-like chemotaxis protein